MKIAKIISTKQVVVNAGSNNGLEVGDTLEIIDKFGTDPVIDPDTGEELGTLDIPKGKVIVSKVYPNMAIADSPKVPRDAFTASLMTPNSDLANRLFGTNTMSKDLNVDPKQITGGIPSPTNSPIRIGDVVIKRD